MSVLYLSRTGEVGRWLDPVPQPRVLVARASVACVAGVARILVGNDGGKPLTIQAVTAVADPRATVSPSLPVSVAPGEAVEVVVTTTSAGHVLLDTNDPVAGRVAVGVT